MWKERFNFSIRNWNARTTQSKEYKFKLGCKLETIKWTEIV